jgi:chromosome segregation ATPase
MEDWQQWQIRADQIASTLRDEVDTLERDFFGDEVQDDKLRAFWPRFRDLKERVRTAPAIRLEAKLDLERRLRHLGSRAYKAQERTYAQSAQRKGELLARIAALRSSAEELDDPRALRALRRDVDRARQDFESGPPLVPPDRQAVWDAWREANQFVWDRLTSAWGRNEQFLRSLLDGARDHLSPGNTGAARQAVSRFFEAVRTHECKQASLNRLKDEAEAIRSQAEEIEHRKESERLAVRQQQLASPVEGWRAELDRNREALARLQDEVEGLENDAREASSILEQAMIRGNLVDKKRKLAELQRANKSLEQRIEQTEEMPLISTG